MKFWNYLNRKEIGKRFKWLMGRIWPVASPFRVWRPAERGTPASLLPGPRPKWLSMLRPAQGRGSAAWPACALVGVTCTVCAVTAHAAHTVVLLAEAQRWIRSGKVLGYSTTAKRWMRQARRLERGAHPNSSATCGGRAEAPAQRR
jgi:hypothetical protein